MRKHDFEFKPSRFYLALLLLTLGLSITILILLPIHLMAKLILIPFVMIYMGHFIWQYSLLRSPESVHGLRYHADGQWYLVTKHKKYLGQLCGDSTITKWLMVLRFKIPNQYLQKSCVILRDSLAEEDYRQLVVAAKNYD